jgi:hypothetical protein
MKRYTITKYTQKKANQLGVQVFPSENPKYKIDVYNDRGLYLFSGGARGMLDYPSYIQLRGKEYADERRRLYRIRHRKELDAEGTRGWYIARLLW